MIDPSEIYTQYLADFGQAVTVNGTSCTGVFDTRHEQIQISEGMEYSTTAPALHITTADAAACRADVDKGVLIGTTRYLISDVQPDGLGLTTLILRKT